MRFCLISTHTDQTIGYSKVAYNILKELSSFSANLQKSGSNSKEVSLFHFGFQRHPARANVKPIPSNVVSYDAAANEDPKEEGFGFNKIKDYLEMVQPHVIFIYNDVLTIAKFLDKIIVADKKPKFKIWLYLDVMYEGMHPSLVKKIFEHTDKIYLFSKTGMQQMKYIYGGDAAGNVDIYGKMPELGLIEHSVDKTVFYPIALSSSQTVSREKLGLTKNDIVFLNCNRNSARKRLDVCVMAFVRLLKKLSCTDSTNLTILSSSNSPSTTKTQTIRNSSVYFIFATAASNKSGALAHFDIVRIYHEELKRFNLNIEEYKKRLIVIDTSANVISDAMMNDLYNLCDIGVNSSSGEGFGLCTFEHMVANNGAQIVTDVGCYSEYLKNNSDVECGLIVKNNGYAYFDAAQSAFGIEYPTVSIEDFSEAFFECSQNLEIWKQRSSKLKLKTWKESVKVLWDDILNIHL